MERALDDVSSEVGPGRVGAARRRWREEKRKKRDRKETEKKKKKKKTLTSPDVVVFRFKTSSLSPPSSTPLLSLEARPDLLHARPRPLLRQGEGRKVRRQAPERLCAVPRLRPDGHELPEGNEDARARGGHSRVAVAGAAGLLGGAEERAVLRGEGGDRVLR